MWTRRYGIAGVIAGLACGVSADGGDAEARRAQSMALYEQQVKDRDPRAEMVAAYQRMADEAATPAEREIAALRQRIALANLEMSRKNHDLNQSQNDLEQADPLARGLRAELSKLEILTQEARAKLSRHIDALPEVQAMMEERASLIREIQDLRALERELLSSRSGDDEQGHGNSEGGDS